MNEKQTITHFKAIGNLRPPCIPDNQKGWGLGDYFAVKSKELRDLLIEKDGGKSRFDTYESCGLFWWVFRCGCGGQTPFGFEKNGFIVEKWIA